ncbi:MAG: SIR2 family protein [Thaumarchaeota archaeon]|nr:SIR2 family protein [Nitrososphaerota archaeon]
MNPKVVYVLGAGFSNGAKLPISSEFLIDDSFDYLKNKLKDSHSKKRIEKIQRYVQFRLDNGYFANNIEEVLNHVATANYLFMESVSDKNESYSADDIFDNLLWYITCLINEKTTDIVKRIPKEYSTFLKHVHKNNYPIITFNYDLIVENTLHNIDLDFQYGIEEDNLDDDFQLILKLHGSLNWSHCNKCGPVNMYDRVLVYGNNSLLCPICKSKSISSILIPPVVYKDSYYNDQLFGSLVRESWSVAREVLSEAKKIVFIGFSMGEDAYAKELFKLSLSMNNNPNLECIVVNKTCSKELKNRYISALVSVKPIFKEITFEEYSKIL